MKMQQYELRKYNNIYYIWLYKINQIISFIDKTGKFISGEEDFFLW